MYDLFAYCNFISDKTRTDAYVEALRQAVTKDSVVLDIGAGTGFFAILACKFGARKAFAVEFNDAILLGREIAKANDVAGRVEFIQDYTNNITLDEKANVAIFDLRGQTPLTNHNITTIIDARKRLLKEDAIFIPKRDIIKAAPVEAFDDYERTIIKTTRERYDLNVEMPLRFLVNEFHFLKDNPKCLLAEHQDWATIDYHIVDTTDFKKELRFEINREGTAHGLAIWFDVELSEGCSYSTSPFADEIVNLYNHPILYFQSPVQVSRGDVLNVNLQAKFIDKDYAWRWDTVVRSKDGQTKAHFRQSTLLANIFSPSGLSRQSSDFIPRLNEEGQTEMLVLSLMGENFNLGEIAKRLTENYPQAFPTWAKAMKYVGGLSKKFSD